jgi:1-deoxy-D-xylulose-5-phosphate synthase
MGKYLDTIHSPADVRKLNVEQLTELAQEIRDTLINTLADTGGHLGPNLGVVEATIAFHKVFESPKDRLLMDVTHQCYVHKMLTGRRDRLATIRQTDGLCGFMVRSEGPHDSFGAGHAGTALSAALGMAAARDKAGTDEHVVALIGDAALTCGVTYEAMNNVKHTTKRLIVILNDNEWSIDKNVGAIAQHLNRIVTNPTYNRMHKDFDSFLKKVPFGDRLLTLERKAEEAAKSMLFPSVIFEELGLRYIGPIDGHDLKALIANLEFCKRSEEPVLLHIRTTKGRGAHFALDNPEKFHGCSPYDPVTGKSRGSAANTPAWQDVFGDIMLRSCQTHSKLVGITGAMPSGTGLNKLRDKMPDRYFDVGIAEEHAVVFAAGMATMGFRPVVAIYSTFLQRAYDMIIHDVALQGLPVIFCMDRAGLSAGDGPTHHGLFDVAYGRTVPNAVLMQPKDEDEFQDMFATALTLNRAVFIRYPRGAAMGVPVKDHPQILQVGKAEVLQHGHDVAVFSYGSMLPMAQDAARQLAERGLSVALINARFAKPLDAECVERYARQCKALLTFEDHNLLGGFGAAVIECLADLRIPTPVARVGWPDKFIEWASSNDVLRQRHGVTAETGVEKTLALLKEQQSDPRFQVVAAAGR